MNHKQVLLKFGLLLTSVVGMAPLSKTIFEFIFLSFCDLRIPIHTCDSCCFFFVLTNNYKYKLLSSRRGLIG